MTPLRQRMLDDLRIRNYSPSTVRAYIRSVADFAEHFKKSPEKLGPEEIRSYQLFLLNEKRVKLSSYIQAICALRFLYRTHYAAESTSTGFRFRGTKKSCPSFSAKPESRPCLKRRGTSSTGRCWPRCTARDFACQKSLSSKSPIWTGNDA